MRLGGRGAARVTRQPLLQATTALTAPRSRSGGRRAVSVAAGAFVVAPAVVALGGFCTVVGGPGVGGEVSPGSSPVADHVNETAVAAP